MAPSFLPDATWDVLGTMLNLSPREGDIVRRLCADEPEASIAHELSISPHTVHSHMERLYRKLGVNSRAQVVLRLFGEYVAQPPPSGTTSDKAPGGATVEIGGYRSRRLFRRVPGERLAGTLSVRCGGRVCDDSLIDLGPGGMRLRASDTLTPAAVLEGVTIHRRRPRGGAVRVQVQRVESEPCRDKGSNGQMYRAVFAEPLPSALCAQLQAALSRGPGDH